MAPEDRSSFGALSTPQPSGRRKESTGNFREMHPTLLLIPTSKTWKMCSTHSKVLSNWKSGPVVWYACPPKAHVLTVWSPAGGAVDVCALFISRPEGGGACERNYIRWDAGCVFPLLFPVCLFASMRRQVCRSHPSIMMPCLTTDCKKWGQVTKERNSETEPKGSL